MNLRDIIACYLNVVVLAVVCDNDNEDNNWKRWESLLKS